MGKLHVSTGKHKVVEITSGAYKDLNVVYVALADKYITYPAYGIKSRIVYIGETRRGALRVTESAAQRAQKIFDTWGINKLTFYTISCTPRRNVKSWEKLESALILRFREIHGKVPLLNDQGKKKQWSDEMKYFTLEKLNKTIDFYSKMKIV